MKTQRMKTNQSLRVSAIASMLIMLVLLFGCFALTVAAETVAVEVDLGDLDFSGSNVSYVSGPPTKEYDGTAEVTGILTKEGTVPKNVAAGDTVTVSVSEAYFVDANGAKTANVDEAVNLVIKFALAGKDAASYTAKDITIPARIVPKKLSWNRNGSAEATYNPDSNAYTDLPVTLPKLVDAKGNEISLDLEDVKVSVTSSNCEDATAQVAVAIRQTPGANDFSNYEIAPLTVDVDIKPLEITEIKLSGTAFTYGSDAINGIVATMTPVGGHECELYIEGLPTQSSNVGVYTVTVKSADAGFVLKVQAEFQIEIMPVTYQVDMDALTFLEEDQNEYHLAIKSLLGEIPEEVLKSVTYTYTKDGVTTDKAVECGVYTVTANLTGNANYVFTDANGEKIESLTRTLTINRKSLAAGTAEAPYRVIITGANGISAGLQASTVVPTDLDRKAISGLKNYRAYALTVGGSAGAYSVLLEIEEALYGENFKPFSVGDLYIYDVANKTLTKVSESTGFTVTLKDGCYQIDGLNADGTYTFVIAPEYDVPFWISAPGIALIILLILALLVLMFFIGLYLHRAQAEKNPVLVIDTEGDAKKVETTVIEETVVEETTVEVETVLEENAEELEAALDKAVQAEEEANAVDVTEETAEAVAESKEDLIEEASNLEEPVEEVAEEVASEEEVTDAMADEVAEELEETVPAEEETLPEPDEERVREAVEEAMAENFNASADAADAIVIAAVAEDAEDEDELNPENLRKVVDAIVDDAMHATMLLPVIEEAAEEAVEEAVEEQVAEEAEVEAADAVETEEPAEAEEPAVCAIIADSVAVAFEKFTVDGVAPEALEGTTADIINASVMVAAKNHLPESWGEELSDTVISGVTEELVARLIKEEPEAVEEAVEEAPVEELAAEEPAEDTPAVQTMAEVSEESDDDDNDDDDDDDNDEAEGADENESFFGLGGLSLDYIDVMKDPEAYRALLMQERNGEVRLVTRYRRSFKSRLIQSQGNVQNYYSLLKNALLTHKGVKGRLSWNYEAFNKGRAHLAKINAKTKTLYLYLALDPEELKDTKYGIVDVSSKKKYATVPVLMKIKGDRKFKYALELINKLCEEKMELPKLDTPEQDYRMDYQSTEALVEQGDIKKLVAGVPVSYFEGADPAPAEEVAVSASADADVSFVAPADDAAVTAAAEELAADASADTTTEE